MENAKLHHHYKKSSQVLSSPGVGTARLNKSHGHFPRPLPKTAQNSSNRLAVLPRRHPLQVYSPYYGVDWIQRWTETKPGDLVSKIPSIVKSLKAEAPILAGKVEIERVRIEQQRHLHELQMEEWRRKEAEKRRLKAIQGSRDQLETVIQTWAKVNSIRSFFDDIALSAERLRPEQRQRVLDRLEKAKDLIGDLDALKHFKAWSPPET